LSRREQRAPGERCQMKRKPAFALALLLIAVLVVSGSVAGTQEGRPSLLLITLDTVRADHIGAYGYTRGSTPVLDELAREGVRFADASTQAPLTGPAHAAILTGCYPARLGIRDNASTPIPAAAPSLAGSLRAAGYETGGFIAAFVLDRAYGFDHGFETFDDNFARFETGDKLKVERTAGEVLKPALAWLSRQRPGRPFFAWVHFYDAHAPYTPPAPYKTRFRARPYDGEIAYVDASVGKLVAALRNKGLLENTMIVAIGDHGEGLGEHGEQEHGIFLYDSTLHVPWIIRLPRNAHAGALVREQVRAIDLMPTVLALLGVPAPQSVDGENLADVIAGHPRRTPPPSYAETYYPLLHFGWSPLHSLRVGEWKYISAPKPELYDLRRDTAELSNVIVRQSNVAGRMDSDMRGVVEGFGTSAGTTPPVPDSDTLARLRSLGYVGFTPSAVSASGPDPKDMVAKLDEFRRLLTDASDALRRNEPAVAIRKLKQALAINERAYDVHLDLGDAYAEQRDYDRAVGEYEAAAVLNPKSADPLVASANALVAAGRTDEAAKKIDQASRLEPESAEVASARGHLDEHEGLLVKALGDYREAVRRNPSDLTLRGQVVNLAIRLRQWDIATTELQALLSSGFSPARTHFGLGQVAEGRGDRTTAAREYETALRLDPALRDAREALARLKRR
jgi:choline-sulfatase